MAVVYSFNKPFRVISQFTPDAGKQCLKDFINVPNIYCAGRLDYDSEGLLLLTDDGKLQHELSHPKFGTKKHYWVQVEGTPSKESLVALLNGVMLKDGPAFAVAANRIDEPKLWPREPPIRVRKHIPDSWLEIVISEGRNRQVRRMTANIGHPTLRLIRHQIGRFTLADLAPGELSQETIETKIPGQVP
ncbi:MAG: pseudouridine synthase [Pseudomonadota bacterium]